MARKQLPPVAPSRSHLSQLRSRYAAQQDANSDIPCCVRFAVPRDGGPKYKVVHGMRDLAEIKVAIAGGSDEPHFCLSMKHKPTGQVATINFSSWTFKQPAGTASRVVNKYPDTPCTYLRVKDLTGVRTISEGRGKLSSTTIEII